MHKIKKVQNNMIRCCFNQPKTSSTSSNTQVPQNLVTRIYQTQVFNSPVFLTLTWSKTLVSHSLTISIPDTFSVTIPLKPSTFSFFKTRPRSKSIYTHKHSKKVKLYWDFARAAFSQNSAEPNSCFYLVICSNDKLDFFLGDLPMKLMRYQRGEQTLLSRREHVFGSMSFVSRGEFMGSKREIEIECDIDDMMLRVKVDREVCLVVERLAWKFRGNEKIIIDGIEVEIYWDVLSWVVNRDNGNGGNGYGVFVFQVGDCVVWPEIVDREKRFMKKSLPEFTMVPTTSIISPSRLSSEVLQWAEESSDGGRRSSCSSLSSRSCGSNSGFSLLLYAWRRD